MPDNMVTPTTIEDENLPEARCSCGWKGELWAVQDHVCQPRDLLAERDFLLSLLADFVEGQAVRSRSGLVLVMVPNEVFHAAAERVRGWIPMDDPEG
jgi:hypothetical protein